MKTVRAKRPRDLEREKGRLDKAAVELTPDKLILKEVTLSLMQGPDR